ncbi:EutN/CcmL family microcompartment protein [Paradesulfitobacterium aromaticivorans]
MYIGKVVGTVVSTSKDVRLIGSKLLLIVPLSFHSGRADYPLVAVDSVGAGVGETVLYVKGSTASRSAAKDSPVDCAIVGIIDDLEVDEQLLQTENLRIISGEV